MIDRADRMGRHERHSDATGRRRLRSASPFSGLRPRATAATLELVVVSARRTSRRSRSGPVAGALLALGHRERTGDRVLSSRLSRSRPRVSRSRGSSFSGSAHGRAHSLAMLDVAGPVRCDPRARVPPSRRRYDVVPWVLLTGAAVVAGLDARRPPTARICSRRPLAVRVAITAVIVGACAFLGAAVSSFYPRSLFTPERLWLCALVALLVAAARGLRLIRIELARRRRAIDAVVADHDRPRRDRRERLLADTPIRLRLLPRPRQRDAPRASAAGRHVLAVRRRDVLRARRRVPRGAAHLRRAAGRPLPRLRGRVRARLRRPAPRVHGRSSSPSSGSPWRSSRTSACRCRRISRIPARGRFASACPGW